MSESSSECLNPGGALLPFFGRYDAAHRARYEFATRFFSDGLCVDFGCGYGFGTDLIASSAPNTVIGLDVDRRCISYASKRFRANNLRFQLTNSIDIPLADKSVGLITCFEVIEHLRLDQIRGFFAEARRVLTPTGLVIGSTPNALLRHHADLVYHIQEFAPNELHELASESGFEVELRCQGDGAGHISSTFERILETLPTSAKRSRTLKVFQSLYYATLGASKESHSEATRIRDGPIEQASDIIFTLRPPKSPEKPGL